MVKKINFNNWDWSEIERNFFFTRQENSNKMATIQKILEKGSSIGAIIQINVSGIPVGLGEPVFDVEA